MSFWTLENLARVSGGRWLRAPVDAARAATGINTDTRTVQAGQAFLALKGEKFDAHDFLAAAAKAGAAVLIVSDEAKVQLAIGNRQSAILLVPDTLAALQRLAAAYREALAAAGCRVIAVGGSNGKTTTRHLIHTVLSARWRGTQSPKSFNNHIGVPLTVLGAKEGDQFVVVEIGTNHPGEIAALGRIVRPDAAVITSIGHEHMEFFQTLDGVAREEAELLRFVQEGGVAVVQQEALERFRRLAISEETAEGLRWVSFGGAAGELRLAGAPVAEGAGQRFRTVDGLEVRLPLPGEHNAGYALAAVAVARWMGLEDAAIARALEGATAAPMRMEVRKCGAGVLILDAYNANPDSMAAGVRTLVGFVRGDQGASTVCTDKLRGLRLSVAPGPGSWVAGHGRLRGSDSAPLAVAPAPRRVAILGDMLELGPAGPDLHRQVGRLLAEQGEAIAQAILIGKLSMYTAEALARSWPPERVHAFPLWGEELPAQVAALLRPGDVVLVKASRGMALERLAPAIEAAISEGATEEHG